MIYSILLKEHTSIMSVLDVLVVEIFSTYGMPFLFAAILVLLFAKNYQQIKLRVLSKAISTFDDAYDKTMYVYKKALFAPLHHFKSKDWKLQNKGLLRIVEIGVRTGTNLKYYPLNSKVTLVDCNMYAETYLKSKPDITSHLDVERILVTSRNDLQDIKSDSIDAVIGTLVLSSTNRVNYLLKEIRRILAPGGMYFFLEHVPGEKWTGLRIIQDFLCNTKIWPTLLGGFHLNRNIESNIKQAGFSDVTFQHFTLHSEFFFLKLLKTHVMGIAVK